MRKFLEMFQQFGRNQQIAIAFTALISLLAFGLVLGGHLSGEIWLYAMIGFVPGCLGLTTGQSTYLKRSAIKSQQKPSE